MSKHTPGPWRVLTVTQEEIKANHDAIPTGASHYSGDYIAVLGSDGSVVCDNAGYYAQPITKDDARLIAQAPRLLEALESAVRLLSGIEGISRNNLFALADEEIESAMSVIKAAKGESHD